jgi:hypothetical protein
MNTSETEAEWTLTSHKVFWGEIAPCDHVVQIYEDNEMFLDLLTGFVSAGIEAGDSVIVIATAAHLQAVHERIASRGLNVFALKLKDLYIPIDAEEALGQFIVNDWPDENLFMHFLSNLLARAKRSNRQVRVFGEMVALLWAKGHVGATVRLEHLWNKFCERQQFALFCAYPKSGFTKNASESVLDICCAHSKMVTGVGKTDLLYKRIEQKKPG